MDSSAGLRDAILAELNAEPTRAEQLGMRFGRPRIPDRPDDDADRDAWVSYVVALGADRTFVTETTAHFDEEAKQAIPVPPLTVQQLVELAGRLGG